MRVLATILTLCALLFANAAVVDLDSSTYDSAIADESVVHFVKYYAPWCGHCKKLAPGWEELSNDDIVTKSGKKVVIAKVDCTQQADICTKNNVKGYPTLMLHKKDGSEPEKYNGAREVSKLAEFLRSA